MAQAFVNVVADQSKFGPVCMVADLREQENRPPMFLVATRPAYSSGSVMEWLERICVEQELDHGPIEVLKFGSSPALGCNAVMRGRDKSKIFFVLLEDGGRLINVGFLTPPAKWDQSQATMKTMVGSFRLDKPRGPTAPLTAVSAPPPMKKP
jgi:hypothetical protein